MGSLYNFRNIRKKRDIEHLRKILRLAHDLFVDVNVFSNYFVEIYFQIFTYSVRHGREFNSEKSKIMEALNGVLIVIRTSKKTKRNILKTASTITVETTKKTKF